MQRCAGHRTRETDDPRARWWHLACLVHNLPMDAATDSRVSLAQGRLRSLIEAVVVVAGVVAILYTDRQPFVTAETDAVARIFISGAEMLALVGAVVALGQSWSSLALGGRDVLRQLLFGFMVAPPAYVLVGFGSGVVVIAAMLLGGVTVEGIMQAKKPMFEATGGVSPSMILPVSFFVGFYEEFIFRGFLQSRLSNVTRNLPAAVVVTALVFGGLHYPTQGWLGAAQTASLGLVLGALVAWRRSLWPAVTCHAGIDTIGLALILWVRPLLEETLHQLQHRS